MSNEAQAGAGFGLTAANGPSGTNTCSGEVRVANRRVRVVRFVRCSCGFELTQYTDAAPEKWVAGRAAIRAHKKRCDGAWKVGEYQEKES